MGLDPETRESWLSRGHREIYESNEQAIGPVEGHIIYRADVFDDQARGKVTDDTDRQTEILPISPALRLIIRNAVNDAEI